jgi:hypothetical protein
MSQPPPNQPRPKALAALEPLIARATEIVKFLRRAVEHLRVAGGDSGRAVSLLRRAEERLVRLREGRRELLEGDAQDEAARGNAEAARQRQQQQQSPKPSGDEGEPR